MSNAPSETAIAEGELATTLHECGDLHAEAAEVHADIVAHLPDLIAVGEQADDPSPELQARLDDVREMRAHHEAAREREGDLARFYWAAARLFMSGDWRYQDLKYVLELLEATAPAPETEQTPPA